MLYKFLDGSFQVIGTIFGFTFWTVILPVLGNSNLYTHNMNKASRDTSSVLSEFSSSGDSMAHEYAIRGCPVFALKVDAAGHLQKIFSTVNSMALREATED